MSKKAKIGISLVTFAVALSIGAQFYTNYKIDQTLKNFPYHLRDKLTLNIIQTNKSFFQRELSFELVGAKENKTEVITTKLTAFPFAITADSKLSTSLVKELNKNFNITIDKNVINSKFSVIGDYLQSNIITEFRDSTNKPQEFEMSLNLASKTQFMDINTSLTGLNYDTQNEIKNLKANITLVPIGHSNYDLSTLDLTIDKANVYLYDGNNNQISLDNIVYNIDKTLSSETYNLANQLKIAQVTVSKKNENNEKGTSNEKNLIEIEDFQTRFNLDEVPNNLIFSDMTKYLNKEKTDYTDAKNLVLNLLLESKQANFNFSTKEANILLEEKINATLKDIGFKIDSIQEDTDAAKIITTLDVAQLNAKNKEYPLSIDSLTFKNETHTINLKEYASFVQFMFNYHGQHSKELDDKTLTSALNSFAQHYPKEITTSLQVKTFSDGENSINDLSVSLKDNIEGNDTNKKLLHASVGKFTYPQERLSITDLVLNVPITLTDYKNILHVNLCYSYLEPYNIIPNCSPLVDEQLNQALQNSELKIDNADLVLNITDIDNNKVLGRITDTLKMEFPPLKEKQKISAFELINKRMEIANIDNLLTIGKSLVDNQDKSLANSLLWQDLHQDIKPNEQLSPYFVEDEENYIVDYKKVNNETWFNGKTQKDIEKILSEQSSSQASDLLESNKQIDTEKPNANTVSPVESAPVKSSSDKKHE